MVTFNVTMLACEKATSWLDAVHLLQEVSKQETFGGEGGRVEADVEMSCAILGKCHW